MLDKIKKSKNHNGYIKKDLASKAPTIKVESVSKKFGSFQALKEVSFEVKKGETIGLIGGNGAGKTTMSEIIAGITKPSSGTLTYGFDYNETPQEKIGMQFQDSNYPSGLTVKHIIRFALKLHKTDIKKSELREIMRTFQMGEFYKRKARSLSGGQRQKLNILLSILHKPDLVILDELSTGLDISARKDIINFTIKLLAENKTSAILISHHMSEIKALCKRVIILDNGTVKKIDTVKNIEKKFGSLDNFVEELISDSNNENYEDNEFTVDDKEVK